MSRLSPLPVIMAMDMVSGCNASMDQFINDLRQTNDEFRNKEQVHSDCFNFSNL